MAPAPVLPKHCERPCAKRLVGHGGPSSTTALALGPRAVAFRRQLDEALAEENLGNIHQLWDTWTVLDLSDLPLDTREHNIVRRRVLCIAREQLRKAVCTSSSYLDEVLQQANAVEQHWPYAFGVKASLEYKAALRLQHEREEQCAATEKSFPAPGRPEVDDAQSTSVGSEPGEDTSADEMTQQANDMEEGEKEEEVVEGSENEDTDEEDEEDDDEDDWKEETEEDVDEKEHRDGRRRTVSFKE